MIRHHQLPARRRRPTRQRPDSRREQPAGATLVEFSLVLPIILVLFFGSIEMTRLNTVRHTAANAAYEGARQAIVAGGTAQDARDEVLRLLSAVRMANDAEVDVEQWPDRVRVTVRVPLLSNSWGSTRFTAGSVIEQSVTLNREIVNHGL